MQLSHALRQSTNFFGGRLPFQLFLAPSAIRVGTRHLGTLSVVLHNVFFQTPRRMSTSDIDNIIEGFVRGPKVAQSSGFNSVRIHAAHGCECYGPFPFF